MARTKEAPPKKAPAKRGSMGVNTYNAELAELAQNAAVAEESALSGGAFLSTKGGRLSFGGNPVPGDKMNVVVLDSVFENHYYDVPFDPKTPASPVCYAFGRNEDAMEPHKECSDPQAHKCKGCPHNEWNSAKKGKGKACSNVRRLALLPEGALEDIPNSEVAYLKVPVMSVKNWASYVTQLNTTLKKPPLGVVTEISVVPDDQSQFRVQFKLVREIKDANEISELMDRYRIEKDRIAFAYREQPAPEVKGKKSAAKPKVKPAPAKAAPARGRR